MNRQRQPFGDGGLAHTGLTDEQRVVLPSATKNLNRAVDGLKSRLIIESVREAGSKTRAAERLGIPRQSLQKMMKRLGIRDEDIPSD